MAIPESIFDKSAWYLHAYSGTLSHAEWKKTTIAAYEDVDAITKGDHNSSMKTLQKMVAYYCMEIGPNQRGRQASSKFRRVHEWADFRKSDNWWLDEWKDRQSFDKMVAEIRIKSAHLPSLNPYQIEDDAESREALGAILRVIDKKHGREAAIEAEKEMRDLISWYSGGPILYVVDNGEVYKRELVPTIVNRYFLERYLISVYGEKIILVKKKWASQ